MLQKTTSAPQQTTEILQQLLLDLTFVKQKVSNKSFSDSSDSFFFFLPPPGFSKKIPSLRLQRIFSPHMQDTQENNSRKSSWKYLERAPLCFQVAFSLPAWWNLFQMIHPEMRTFNFSFTLDRATRNQGSSGSFTLKHLKSIKSSQISPTALSWFIQQTQTSSQSSQWHKMKLNSRRNTIYHFGSRTKLKECSVITSNLACPSLASPQATAHYPRALSGLIMPVITVQWPSVTPAAGWPVSQGPCWH